jgi:hypothetical protein
MGQEFLVPARTLIGVKLLSIILHWNHYINLEEPWVPQPNPD